MTANSKVPISDKEDLFHYICMSISGQAYEVNWDQLNLDDWSWMYQTSKKERVAPLLYWSLVVPE